LRQYQLGGEGMTLIIAIGLIGMEIVAVPFLFRLSLSRVARFVSVFVGALLPYAWTVMTLHVFLVNATVMNAGYFGGFLRFQVGGLALAVDLIWMVVVGLTFGAIGGKKVLRLKG